MTVPCATDISGKVLERTRVSCQPMIDRLHLRMAALLAVYTFAGPLGPVACRSITDPSLPVAAERFAPPPAYVRWWTITEACSGITRPLGDRLASFRVPGRQLYRGCYLQLASCLYSADSDAVTRVGQRRTTFENFIMIS